MSSARALRALQSSPGWVTESPEAVSKRLATKFLKDVSLALDRPAWLKFRKLLSNYWRDKSRVAKKTLRRDVVTKALEMLKGHGRLVQTFKAYASDTM